MAFSAVSAVEGLGVDAVQAMEPIGELVSERLDDEVIVIRHQAEDVDKPVIPHNDVREEREEETAVVVGSEDPRSFDPPRSDMVGAVRGDVPRKGAPSGPRGAPVPVTRSRGQIPVY